MREDDKIDYNQIYSFHHSLTSTVQYMYVCIMYVCNVCMYVMYVCICMYIYIHVYINLRFRTAQIINRDVQDFS